MSDVNSDSGSDASSSYSDEKPDKTALCLRKIANFSNIKPAFQIDNKAFNPELMKLTIPEASPKLDTLFKKIKELDAKDLRKHGKLFKHFIYSDVLTPSLGAKLVASAFVAMDYLPVFTPQFTFKSDKELLQTKSNNFGLLMSKPIFGKSMPQKFRKAMAAKYNERPDNVHGELMRFIILDNGFKEGLDLFDVKYVHLFEPLIVRADEKQAIGRGTRFCGQKGLEFNKTFGWPLYVFRYDIEFNKGKIHDTNTMFELYLKYSDIDLRKIVFAAELETAVIDASIDKHLNKEIHTFKIDQPPPVLAVTAGGSLKTDHKYIDDNFKQYKYPKVTLENKCEEKLDAAITFSPTQDFIRTYFTPRTEQKGMLLYHSVGSGKTCTAIATATSTFDKEDYTILWVTRHTLKSDFWKNMFQQICHMQFISNGRKFPTKVGAPMKHLSKNWMETISYKQFSNMLLKLNKYYTEITKRNGTTDPLRKTLLIIDEAHKLYTTTGPKAEQPNMRILERMIQNSYEQSGKDSVRILLMTATPYTSDPMEIISLLNLLRKKKLSDDFDEFSKEYLNKDGLFSSTGLTKFQNDISGYISYVNRSQDARNFAHPIIEPVYTNMTYTADRKPSKFLDLEMKEMMVKMKDQREIIKEEKEECKDKLKEFRVECREDYQNKIKELKSDMKTQKTKCAKNKDCISKVVNKFDKLLDQQKENKKEVIADCINKETDKHCSGLKVAENALNKIKGDRAGHKKILDDSRIKNKELTIETKELREKLTSFRSNKKTLVEEKKALRKLLKTKPDTIKEIKLMNQKIKDLTNEYLTLKGKAVDNNNNKKLNRVKIGRAVLEDSSIEKMIGKKCNI